MPYPSKPWTNNQEYEIFPGKMYRFDSAQNVWVRINTVVTDSELEVNNLNLDSDFRVLISLIDGGLF